MQRRTFILVAVALAFGVFGVRPDVAPAATSPLVISTPTSDQLPTATVGVAYGVGISTTGGGRRPVTFAIVSGKLPAGLSLAKSLSNSSTQVTGVPKSAGVWVFTVKAKDASGNTATRAFSLTVAP